MDNPVITTARPMNLLRIIIGRGELAKTDTRQMHQQKQRSPAVAFPGTPAAGGRYSMVRGPNSNSNVS